MSRPTRYFWEGRDGQVPQQYVDEDGPEEVDIFHPTEDLAVNYFEEELEPEYSDDELSKLTMYDTTGDKIMEGTDLMTEQAGLTDW